MFGAIIAESNHALIHSSRKIELRLILDKGESPKLILEIPKIIWISGKLFLIFSIALIVSFAFYLSSSIPVDIDKASGSKNTS